MLKGSMREGDSGTTLSRYLRRTTPPRDVSAASAIVMDGASGKILVRGDSAYGSRAVVRACLRGKAEFSLVMTKNRAIPRYRLDPGAGMDSSPLPGPGARSRHRGRGSPTPRYREVAELTYTAFAHTRDRITARLVVRRVTRHA